MIISFVLMLAQPNPLSLRESLREQISQNYTNGICLAKSGKVSLQEINFIQGNKIYLNGWSGWKYALTSGPNVILGDGKKELVINVRILIDERQPQDVQLSLAMKQNEPIIFWREPFLNRSYKQGVLKITQDGLDEYCFGGGGIDSSH